MNKRIVLFATIAVGGALGGVCTRALPPVQAQSVDASSVQSLKASNQRLEAKVRAMQSQINSLQAQLQAMQLRTNIGAALPFNTGLSPFSDSLTDPSLTYKAPGYQSPSYRVYSAPTYQAPASPRLSNIPDCRVVLLSKSR